jgi:chloramphenicol 3-O phosphotransferase
VPSDRKGRVILLTGTSSAGKTSIGWALQGVLPDPWFLVPVDLISGMRTHPLVPAPDAIETEQVLLRTRRGYHRVIAALASEGNDVIMDYPLSEPCRVDDLIVVLDGYDVMVVQVQCSLEELARREQCRGDRPIGLAASQASGYMIEDYDLAVDTTDTNAETCAFMIANALEVVPSPRAFERLRHLRNTAYRD